MNIKIYLLRFLKKIRKLFPTKPVKLLEFHIVEQCNLNCKSCIHFSPLAEEEFLDIKTFENDVKRLSEITDKQVETINILGGEPLLHKDILLFFDTARRYFPHSIIQLVTNGILLQTENDAFWNNCKKNKVLIAVSQYPIKTDWIKVRDTAKKFNVNIGFFSASKKHSQWHFPLDLNGKQNKYTNFINCQEANNCINVYKGKLFVCPIASNIRHFNKYFNKNIPLTNKDYLDIYSIKTVDEISKFCAKPTPICAYCKIKGRTFDNEWGISSKDIKEWT